MNNKKIWIALNGYDEDRYTAFAAISPQSALAYLIETQPDKEWELTDKIVAQTEFCGPYRDIYIAPKGPNPGYNSDRYDLEVTELAVE